MYTEERPQSEPGGNRKPPATIYDIARVVGVSASTVSRALSKPGRINIKTEKRIRDAAAELGYRINPMARALPTGRTGTVALILSDITNPVYFDLIRGAERVTAADGRTLVLAESQESSEREVASAERLQPSVDGIILVSSRIDDDRIRSLAEVKPLILVNRQVAGVPAVVPDVLPGLSGAIDHLAGLGHRSVGFLSGPTTSWMNQLRWRTLFDLAVSKSMSIVEIGPASPTLEGGRTLLTRVRAAGVTSVLTFNDLMALGLLRACQDENISVPGELSIVGFDDIFGADLTTPSLTTIRSPLASLGETAVQMLADASAVSAGSALATTFVRRESTGAPRP